MRRPLRRFVVTASVAAACAALAACSGGSDTTDQGDPVSLGSDTAALPGASATDRNG